MKRRLLGIFISFVLLIAWSGDMVLWGDNADISVLSCDVDTVPVHASGHFNLTLALANESGEDLTNLYFIIDANSNFYLPNSTSKMPLDALNSGVTRKEYQIELVYNGGDDNKLGFTIRYKKGSETLEMLDFIYIDAVPKSEGTSSGSSGRLPSLSVIGGTAIPVATAGEPVTVNIPIENTTKYLAQDITVSPDFGEGTDIPFQLDRMKTGASIARITANSSDTVSFTFSVLPDAAEKIYPLKLNFRYYSSNGTECTSADTIYIKVINENTGPKVVIDSIKYVGSDLTAGEKNPVSIVLRNEGGQKAKDVKAVLAGLKSDGFTVFDTTDTRIVKELEAAKAVVLEYLLIPSKDMESGNYALTLKLDYKDEGNAAYTEESGIFLPVRGLEQVNAEIALENIEAPQTEIKPEQDFKIAFDVANKGDSAVKNLKISLSTDKELISKSLSVKNIKLLDKEKNERVEFILNATADAATKNYPILIQAEYDEGSGEKAEKQTVSQYVGVLVNGDGNKSTPRIIVDRYRYEPQVIKGGDTLSMRISLLNTSETAEVRNIKVSLTSEEGIFNPVDSSNTFYVEAIKPRERVEKVQALEVKYDAAHKTYGITVNIDYEDAKGTQFNAKDLISIPVIQVPKLVLGDLNLPPELFVGQPIPLSLEFYNMGKSTLNNLMIKTEGNFQTQNSNYYVGNFDSGRSDVYEVMLIPTQEGACKGNILFYFEDGAGQPEEIAKEIAFTVSAIPQEMPMEGEGMGAMEKPTVWTKIRDGFKNPVIAVETAVIAGVIVVFAVRKIRKRRRDMTLDE